MTGTGRYTVGVFQDAGWARRGVDALLADGFVPESLSIVAKDSPDGAALIESALGTPAQRLDLKALGAALGAGPLVGVLQGSDEGLSSAGIAGTINRAGFQLHDGHIYEVLVGRGGVLVGIRNEPRAADALARLHAYGGGNAAIGAWTGRV